MAGVFGNPITSMASAPGFSFGANNPGTLGSAGTLFSTASLPAGNPSATTMASSSTGGLFGGLSSAAPSMAGSTFGGGLGTGMFGMTAPPSLGVSFSQPGVFGGLTSVAPNTAASTGLGLFGSTVPTTASSLGGFGQGAQTVTTQSLGLGGGFFGSTGLSATNQLLGSTAPAAPVVTGLGGFGVSQSAVEGSNEAKNDSKSLKEFPVPPEIMSLTEDFKKYIKEQKVIREEISRTSSTQLMKVQEEIGNQKQLLSVVSKGIHRNLATIKKLKQETVQELKYSEIMQRTKDIPLALQYENTSPMEYFQWLTREFEVKMQTYRQQIAMMERHLELITHSSAITSQELTLTLKRFHETLIFLAAELHTLNEKVAAQKEHFLMYRRLVHRDSSNIFASVSKAKPSISSRSVGVPVTVGPSPFGHSYSVTTMALASALEKAQQPSGAPPTFGLASTSFGTSMGFSSGFGGTSTVGTPQFRPGSGVGSLGGSFSALPFNPQGSSSSGLYTPATPVTPAPVFGVAAANKTFQLQKPPAGNKRGKR